MIPTRPSKLWTLPLALVVAGVVAPEPAAAQLVARPVILGEPVMPTRATRFNIEDIGTTAPVELRWQTAVGQTLTWEYELTYDVGASTSSPAPSRVKIADTSSDENNGPAENAVQYTHRLYFRDIVRDTELPENGGVDAARRNIVVRVYEAGDPLNEERSATYTWTFEYDTKVPPAPIAAMYSPGDRRLEVSWSAPSPDTDVNVYEVVYIPVVGTATDGYVIDPADPNLKTQRVGKNTLKASLTDGLINGVPAAFAIRSIDEYENTGELGPTSVGVPVEVSDFWQYYKKEGGLEEGGFCFIATAAYGSYAHPAVLLLRTFRDRVLAKFWLGEAFVWTYYQLSPPLAGHVRSDRELASVVRLMLWPVALTGVVIMMLPLAGGLLLLGLLLRTRRRSRARWLPWRQLGGFSLVVATLFAVPESAEAFEGRPGAEDAIGLGFYFKGGPYLPEMGEADAEGAGFGAFYEVFSDRVKPLFSLGLDYQFFRKFGSAGVGGTFGFMQFVGRGRFAEGEDVGKVASDTTVFNILPLTVTAFYRFDVLADRFNIPFVPYARFGLAYHFWWVTNGRGNVSLYEPGSGDALEGRGGKLGYTGTVGIAILLNWVDKKAAAGLYESTRIRGTYIFAELETQRVDGFGSDGFDLSDNTWNLGLYLEL